MSLLSVFVKYRALIHQLVMRDIKTKYRRSILGLLWTVLNPLLMMAVLSIVFSYFFQRYGEVENFPVYLLCGQLVFNFFNESTSIAMGSIVHSGELIKKVYVPKYLFPITKVMSSGVNLLASMIALVIVMVVTRSRVTPTVMLAVVPLLYVLLFSTGVSLLLSAVAGAWAYVIGKKGRVLEKTALTLVLAGGASNLYDRLKRGYVVDYFSIQWKKLKKVVFNLGDIFIFAGSALFAAVQLVEELREILPKEKIFLKEEE